MTPLIAALIFLMFSKKKPTPAKKKGKRRQRNIQDILQWEPLVRSYASQHSWPANFSPVAFGLATIDHETGGTGQPDLISALNKNGSRDYGLFQNNDRYFEERGLTKASALDSDESTKAGMNLIAKLAKKHNGDVAKMASAYNAGHVTSSNQPYADLTVALYAKYKKAIA
jgi:hypothetical protein